VNRSRTTAFAMAPAAAAALVLPAAPVVAQQPVDATNDGGLAFVLFALMVFAFVAIIFSLDRIRRHRSDND